MNNITVLIHTCDAYSDLWDMQISQLKKFWNPNPSIFILTDTNKNNYSYSGVTILCAGIKKELTERMQYALGFIKTEFIFVTLDDYIVNKDVDCDAIDKLVEEMKINNICYMRFFLRPKPTMNDKIDGLKNRYRIQNSRSYGVNLYPAIWTTNFFKFSIGKDVKNPWQYEVSLSKKAVQYNANCQVSLNNEFPFIDTVRKGKFLNKPYRYIKKQGIYNGNRKVNSYWFEIKLNVKTFVNRHTPLFLNKFIKKI